MQKSSLFYVSLFTIFAPLAAEKHILDTKLNNGTQVEIVALEGSSDADTFAKGKQVFMKSFEDGYKNYTPTELYLEDAPGYLPKFLASAFEDEENDFNTRKEHAVFAVAREKESKNVIGFAAYDCHAGNIYIRQLAVDPVHKQQGLGRALVNEVTKNLANTETTVTVCARKINEPAIKLYRKLGFKEATMEEVHPELPAHKYCGFKRAILK